MLEEIRGLYAYNGWANGRLLDAAARLGPEAVARDLGSSFGSVRGTLAHILSADWVWLERWRGRSPTAVPDSWDLSTLDAIRARWAEVESDRRRFLDGLTEPALARPLAYRTTKGEPFEQPLWHTLLHVVNHSTYHRGQVVTLLRQLGAEPVATDLVLYLRSVREAEGPEPDGAGGRPRT